MINGFDYDPMTYIDDMEMTNYIVDCNREYSEVLAENETVHVYGDTLLQSDGETIISGLNNSVIAEIGVDEVKNIRYDDYGYSDEMLSGHGYKGEMQDESGLIYLRARYYDPDLMRFIQINTNYVGEKEEVTSQNRYAYTLNNPYKYVDRDGEKATKGQNKTIFTMSDDEFNRYVRKFPLIKRMTMIGQRIAYKAVNKRKSTTSINNGENKTSGNGGGGKSLNKQLPVKKTVTIKCPKETKYSIPFSFFLRKKRIGISVLDFGIATLTYEKFIQSNLDLSDSEAQQFSHYGLTSKGFNVNLRLDLDTLLETAGALGMDVEFGDWGAIIISVYKAFLNITISVGVRFETLKFWEMSSGTISITSNIYDKDYIKINIIDSFELRLNLLVAVLVTVASYQVLLPLLPELYSAFASVPGTVQAVLETLAVAKAIS